MSPGGIDQSTLTVNDDTRQKINNADNSNFNTGRGIKDEMILDHKAR